MPFTAKILYLPLDERPCNYFYPQAIAQLRDEIELLVPPQSLLGKKKQPADVVRVWQWVKEQVPACHIALLSIEMLVYGGLLPSRLHQATAGKLRERIDQIRTLKHRNPHLEIFASNLIMRTPAYNSSEEEPDYYAEYGDRIFRWGWLTDKQRRDGLSPVEGEKLAQIERELPSAYLQDYRDRRRQNLAVNEQVIDLVNESIISFLAIPQDDSAPYGFTALDQQQVVRNIIALRLQNRIHLYPGADEVGCTLLARAYSQLKGKEKKVYLLYSSVVSEQIIPLYEDRPLGESLKSHLLAAGAISVPTPEAADFILAVNTAGKVMQEAWDNPTKDITYTTYRNLRFFVAQIQHLLAAGKPVALADAAFANGGETELVQLLDDAELWDDLLAYAGWNTACNAIGTVLATAILGVDGGDSATLDLNKIYHLLEGWAYQTVVRMKMVNDFLPTLGASYYDFNGKEAEINREMERRLRQVWDEMMCHSFQQWKFERVKVFSPWQRMFEIGIDLELRKAVV